MQVDCRFFRAEKSDDFIMPLYQAIILAIVQGLTEFLPVSSTAHLAIIPQVLHWKDPGLAFDIALHVGTLAAILIFFFRDWVKIILTGIGIPFERGPGDENSRAMLFYMIVGTIPVGIAGLIFKKQAEGPWRNLIVMGVMLIVIGVLMYIGDRVRPGKAGIESDYLGRCDVDWLGAGSWPIVPGHFAQRHHHHGRTIPVSQIARLPRDFRSCSPRPRSRRLRQKTPGSA